MVNRLRVSDERTETASESTRIHELSFRSLEPLIALPFYAHRVAFNTAVSSADLPSQLGRLAKQLRRVTGLPVLANTTEAMLLSPQALTADDTFQVISTEPIDLIEPRFRRYLKQLLEQHTVSCFRQWGFKVDEYGSKALLKKQHRISNEIESQRFIKWNLRIDEQQHIILAIDYGNDYHDRATIHDRGVLSIEPGTPLVHTYDAKSCRFSRMADYTVSEPRSELGNISLLEYHRRSGKVASQVLTTISPDTLAVLVDYDFSGKRLTGGHIPHLLRKSFSRDDIDSRIFNAQVLDIHSRYKKAIQRIQAFNGSPNSSLVGQRICFDPTPYCPDRQVNFAEQIKNNLVFGPNLYFSYPAAALKQRRLLEKPDRINTVIFHPEAWDVSHWCDRFTTFLREFGIRLETISLRSYSLNSILNVQRQCRDLADAELALLFVPDQDTFRTNPDADPYLAFKREFVAASLPSQAIEQSTLQAGFNPDTGYNVLLGILSKLGYSPWQLRTMPGATQAFLGLDVGRKDGRAVGSAAFIVDRLGRIIGWSAVDFQANRETFNIKALRRILFDLINFFEESKQEKLTHLVIHRDGFLQSDELTILKSLIPELQAEGLQSLDIVEILKTGYDRAAIYDPRQQKWTNPRRGWSWPLSENEAAIMTTGSSELKGSRNFVPRPIILRRRLGDTQLGVLAAQVYWLSEMHIGSTQTIRLPTTTYYADSAATAALKGLLPIGARVSCRLSFV